MENHLSAFERKLRDTYNQDEVDYNHGDWKDLEKELDLIAPTPMKYFGSITTGIAAVGMVFIAMLFFLSDADISKTQVKTLAEVTEISGEGGDLNAVGVTDSTQRQQESSEKVVDELTLAEQNNDAETDLITEAKSAKVKKVAKAKDTPNTNAKASDLPETSGAAGIKKLHQGCSGLTIKFEAGEEYGKDAKYLWNFGDGYFSNEKNPSHTFNRPGTFDVSLSVTSYTTGQITSNVVQGMIEVVETPTAHLLFEIAGPDKILLNNKSYRTSEVEWFVDGKSFGASNDLALTVADKTKYNIELTAFSKGGCVDTLSAIIEAAKPLKGTPTSFSPTAGEVFLPQTEGPVVALHIFEAKSQKPIFSSTSAEGWNGSGHTAEAVYHYVAVSQQGEYFTVYKGQVELK